MAATCGPSRPISASSSRSSSTWPSMRATPCPTAASSPSAPATSPAAECGRLPLPRARAGRLCADRGRGHRHRHRARRAATRSSSPSSPPRRSARAPASACRWSMASSSRRAASSSAPPSPARAPPSTFSCRAIVPIAPDAADAGRRQRRSRPATAAARRRRPPTPPSDLSGSATVLLVEDEDAVRMGGVRALISRGYTVHEASSGVEALEIFDELDGKVDIVVSDVVMPEMDGPTLLGELRKLAARYQVRLRLRLRRRRLRQEPARGRAVRFPAQTVLAQAVGDSREGDLGGVGASSCSLPNTVEGCFSDTPG